MNSPEGGPQAECEFRPLSGPHIDGGQRQSVS